MSSCDGCGAIAAHLDRLERRLDAAHVFVMTEGLINPLDPDRLFAVARRSTDASSQQNPPVDHDR